MNFGGSYTALVTPFAADRVDERAFQDLIEWQIGEGTDGIVPCGTTGESPTLTHHEHHRVVELAIEVAKGRAVVMAGTGSNATAEAIALTRHAERAGADAALVVVPYYNKPTQEGLYQHFRAVHDATGLPIFIYNIPGRSVVDMSVDTMKRLAELPRIAGVKDATSDLARPLRTTLALGDRFRQFSGEDITVVPFLAQGGHGCISVTANLAPRLLADLHRHWREGRLDRVAEINARLAPLHDALFIESNPGPVKWALSLLGRCAPTLRPPLAEPAEPTRRSIEAALRAAGILS